MMNLEAKIRTAAILLTAAILVGPAWGDDVDSGNSAMQSGDFSRATQAYERALASGQSSAGLYYNLSIAQERSGQPARAALSLHRSLLLNPRAVDARIALSEIERSQGVAVRRDDWRDRLAGKVSLGVLLYAGCALAWLGAFAALGAMVNRLKRRRLAMVFAVLILAGGGLVAAASLADPRLRHRNAAVVVSGEGVPLLSAPVDQSTVVSRLVPGAVLDVLRKSGDWAFCEASTGEQGWVPAKSFEAIVPPV